MARRLSLNLALLGLLSATTACVGEVWDIPPWAQSGILQLGDLDRTMGFSAFDGVPELELERGIQGGYHVFVDARLTIAESPQDPVLVTVTLTRDDGVELAQIVHERRVDVTDQDGFPTLPDLIVFVPDPEQAANRTAEVLVELSLLSEEPVDAVTHTARLIPTY